MVSIKKFLIKHRVLILLILLGLLLRFPWLYTTIEKDEGAFGYTAWRLLSDQEDFSLSLIDNKPILLYSLYALPIYFFGNSIIPVRVFNNMLFVVSIIFFFMLVRCFFPKKVATFSTLFYVIFMNIPVFEGYLAMSESLLTPFFIISVFFFKKYVVSRKNGFFLVISSFFAAITVLIKQQAVFIYLLLIGGIFIYKEKNRIKKIAFLFSPLIIILLLITVFIDKAVILRMVGRTLLSLTESTMGFSSGYVSFQYILLLVLEGSLLLLFSIVGMGKILKSRLDKNKKFILLWLILALAFTIIPPAYGHYFQFLILPLSIFSGVGLFYIVNSKQNKKTFILLVTVLVLVTGGLVILHYPDSQFSLGSLHWGWSSLEDYEQQIVLSEYINNVTFPDERILIWGFEPALSWLSEREKFVKNSALLSCDAAKLTNLNLENLEKEAKSFKELKVILFLPGYGKKCSWRDKEVFSDVLEDYNKQLFGEAEVYVKENTQKFNYPSKESLEINSMDFYSRIEKCNWISEEKYKQYCYSGIANEGGSTHFQNPFEYCSSIPKSLREKCYLEAGILLGKEFYDNPNKAFEFCFNPNMEKNNFIACKKGVFLGVGARISQQGIKDFEYCENLTTLYRSACFRGILKGYESDYTPELRQNIFSKCNNLKYPDGCYIGFFYVLSSYALKNISYLETENEYLKQGVYNNISQKVLDYYFQEVGYFLGLNYSKDLDEAFSSCDIFTQGLTESGKELCYQGIFRGFGQTLYP